MKKKLAPLMVLLAAMVLCVGLYGCGGQGQSADQNSDGGSSEEVQTVQEGKLIALSDLAFPPLESVPEGKTAEAAEGFEVDLLQAMADKLGLKLEWQQVKFDTIIPAIKQGGKADVGASAFTITDERGEEIDFTDAFMDSNQGIVMRSADVPDDPVAFLDQEGKKIAVQSGTTGEAWAQENLTHATIVPLDDIIQGMTGLTAGTYDGAVADLPVVSALCKDSYTDCKVVKEIATGEQYGMVVSKDNPGLTKALNKALQELVDDGTVAKLEEKWFGSEL